MSRGDGSKVGKSTRPCWDTEGDVNDPFHRGKNMRNVTPEFVSDRVGVFDGRVGGKGERNQLFSLVRSADFKCARRKGV